MRHHDPAKRYFLSYCPRRQAARCESGLRRQESLQALAVAVPNRNRESVQAQEILAHTEPEARGGRRHLRLLVGRDPDVDTVSFLRAITLRPGRRRREDLAELRAVREPRPGAALRSRSGFSHVPP